MAKLNPERDNQFESFARVVRPQRRTYRERLMEALAAGLKGKDAIRAAKEADEFEDTFRLHDLGYGPAPAVDYNLSFNAPFYDMGNGQVDIRNTITGVNGTFTRATVASCRLSNGLLKKVASGVPRSHYRADGSYGGYLSEGARTNLCLQSEDLGTSWVNVRSSESLNAAVAPDGTTTADKIIEDSTAAATHQMVVPQATIVADSTQTVAGFFKAGERSWVALFCAQDTNANGFGAYFDVVNGVVGSDVVIGAGTVASKVIESWGNGWYRCVVTGAVNGGVTNAGVRIGLANADNGQTYNGDGASGLYAWGMQHEQAAFASSYIPTTTASVTRAADILTYPASGNVLGAVGTAYVECNSGPGASVSVVQRIFAVDDGTTDNRIDCRFVAGNLDCITVSGGVSNGSVVMDTPGVDNQNYKVALSWGARLVGTANPGDGMATDTAYTNIVSATHIGIGVSKGATSPLFGTIKLAQIWKTQMPDAALTAMIA